MSSRSSSESNSSNSNPLPSVNDSAASRTLFTNRRDNESLAQYYQRLGEKSDREDLVMFINACFAATRQNEFYTDRFEQTVSIEFLHRYVMSNYRRIYARSLGAGINHFNQTQIILNLLKSGAPEELDQRAEEGDLIEAALKRLPPNRVYGFFQLLKSQRVNNRRTRAVIRRYLQWRREPEFDAIKYQRKYRAAATHAHVKLANELGDFLFKFKKTKSFKTKLFDQYKKSHYSASAIYDLPFTIAESLANKHNVPRDVFLRNIEHKMTAAEKLRYQTSVANTKGAKIEFDLSQASLTRLAIYVLSLSVEQRVQRAEELSSAFENSVTRAIERVPIKLGRVAAVLDRSRSAMGSRQKRNRPLAVALGTHELLKRASKEYCAFWSLPIINEHAFVVTPKGQSALAQALIDALQWKPDLLLIVSDGYENDPPDAANQIVRVYRDRIANSFDIKNPNQTSDPNNSDSAAVKVPEVVHLNPVFDSDHFSPKPLGDAIPTVGIRDAEDLATMLGFARFASGAAKLDVLEGHLAGLAEELLKGVIS